MIKLNPMKPLDVQVNTDRYENDWKFDTDRRLARLENCDAGDRIAALETWAKDDGWDINALEQRIAALEAGLKKVDAKTEIVARGISDTEKYLVSRIAALEEKFK